MQLRSFDEFLSSLSEKDLDYIYGDNDDEENNRVISVSLGDSDAFLKLSAFTASTSFKMCRRLLEKYHNWISEQLEKQIFHQFLFLN